MKISVIIPAYNSAACIQRAVRSVLEQTRPADEIIVVDDGSADDTADKVAAFGLAVRLIRQSNSGASVARNTGIQAASGDWIAFLDADDEWLPNKLALQQQCILASPHTAWCYSNFIIKDAPQSRPQLAHVPNETPAAAQPQIFEDYLSAYCRGLYAWTSSLLIRKDVFERAGLFVPGMKRAQDNDMWFRIAYQYPQIGYIPQPIAVYHLDTVGSSTKVNTHYSFMKELVDRHLALSVQYGRQEAFIPCVRMMLQTWIRELAGQHSHTEAKDLLNRYRMYLSGRFRREMLFRMAVPILGPAVADSVDAIKRRLKSNPRDINKR